MAGCCENEDDPESRVVDRRGRGRVLGMTFDSKYDKVDEGERYQ